ncbi:membrane protein insertase YidC [Piscinibacter sp.]|uniref:membrane protein insertase YidC n=1 Tax=Piscinibacter sp. TaxID=1903157 RepID=UPI001D76AA87|nr:membrane protein insertase YidC [Piscinibacter sp.]MBK7533337.1 membrane protein insertase YidC [Piscinibacter sp.]
MTDLRRTLLWVVFSMSLVLIWDAWNRHNGEPSMFGPAPVAKPAAAGASTAPGAVPVPSVATPTAATAAPGATPAAVPAAAASAAQAQRVTVTTDLVKATIDTQGASLVRLELLKQRDQNDRSKNVVLFDQSAKRLYTAQTGLIPPAGGAGLPNHHTVMTLVPGDLALRDGSNEVQVRFESPDVGGVKLAKVYTFKRGDHVIGVRHEVINSSGAAINPRLYLQLVRDGNPPEGESSFYFTFTGPAVYTDVTKFQKIDFKTIEKHKAGDKPDHATSGNDGWVAMVQHYFASAWLVDNGSGAKLSREFYTGKIDTNTYSVGMFLPVGEVAAGATKSFDAQLFVGPQEENKLAALAPGLELVKDYGWFTILAKPLFWLLTQLHALIGNWGWSIVALVVLLKMAFYWLNASAYKSMAKMKAINPKVMELRERLKDKPQQMQQEMMRIYREEKVNPLGGCLPIVAQMPFFIALYWVLLSSVEMRQAPWLGWIQDLSAIDPFYILPLLMTGTSLLQTWLNPTPPDPVQAKMMWIMPLIFSVMFFFFPAGLVLYWLTNNILSIAQQYLINKQLGVLGK